MRRLFFRGVAEDAFSLASPEQVESIFQQLALPGVWATIKEKRKRSKGIAEGKEYRDRGNGGAH